MQYEADDFIQEWFSDDGVNVRCVLSWTGGRSSCEGASVLKVNFHNSFHFDSQHSKIRAERVNDALSELQQISRYTLPACGRGSPRN